jgi:HemY protein
MRRFIIFLLILVASSWLGLKIAKDPGFALFSYQHWTVEMPLWAAILALVILFLIGFFCLRLLDGLDFTLFRWRNWLQWRRKYKSYSKTNQGLVDLVEGQWKRAERYVLEGIPQSEAPLINYLAAAKAAQEQTAYDRRDAYLRKAHDLAPHCEIAISLTQAQLLLQQGQLEEAVATLTHLHEIAPKHKMVLALLERLYIRLADWHALLNLLPSLRQAKIISSAQLEIFEKNIYYELLSNAENKADEAVEVEQIWNSMPRKLQDHPLLLGCYAKQVLPYAEHISEVEVLLSKSLKKSWDAELVRLYGLLVADNSLKQLSKAEGWLKRYPSQAVLLLTLGRLCVRCQLWGKARTYFESSLKLEAMPETYLEYGKLLEYLGEFTMAMQSYRDGLML